MAAGNPVVSVMVGSCVAAAIVASPHARKIAPAALTVQQVRTIEAPRVFHPAEDDRPGYWEEFGIAAAFDFSPAAGVLVAVLAKVDAPTRLFVLDLEKGTIRSRPIVSKNPQTRIRAISLSPDGSMVAIPTDREREITLWNIATGTLMHKAQVQANATDVDWHPAGDRMAVVAGKRIEVFSVAAGLTQMASVRMALGETEWPLTARWSPDGSLLAIGTNTPGVLIAKGDGSMVTGLKPPVPNGAVQQLEWNASGDRLAAGALGVNGQILIWKDPKMAIEAPMQDKYEVVRTLTPPPGESFGRLTWDPSGQLIAVGVGTSNAAIWDPAAPSPLATFVAHPKSRVIEAQWKGGYLITVGAFPDKHFRLWRVTR